MTTLFDDSTQSYRTCICLHNKRLSILVKPRKGKDGGLYQLLLKYRKGLFTFLCLLECATFVGEVVKWCCNVSESGNVAPVIGRKAQKRNSGDGTVALYVSQSVTAETAWNRAPLVSFGSCRLRSKRS